MARLTSRRAAASGRSRQRIARESARTGRPSQVTPASLAISASQYASSRLSPLGGMGQGLEWPGSIARPIGAADGGGCGCARIRSLALLESSRQGIFRSRRKPSISSRSSSISGRTKPLGGDRANPCEPRRPATAQEPKQHGFRLIVRVWPSATRSARPEARCSWKIARRCVAPFLLQVAAPQIDYPGTDRNPHSSRQLADEFAVPPRFFPA